MGRAIEVNDALWAGLADVAKRARRTPENLVRSLIREYLEVEADRAQDEALRKATKSSGFKEEDAVRLVNDYRKEMRSRVAARVSDISMLLRRGRY